VVGVPGQHRILAGVIGSDDVRGVVDRAGLTRVALFSGDTAGEGEGEDLVGGGAGDRRRRGGSDRPGDRGADGLVGWALTAGGLEGLVEADPVLPGPEIDGVLRHDPPRLAG